MRITLPSSFRFLSTPSARRATFPAPQPDSRTRISIHALCEEGDWSAASTIAGSYTFLSTPSARRATPRLQGLRRHYCISIHALCEEGDPGHVSVVLCVTDFYPRPLRGGRRVILKLKYDDDEFLSTPSARRATKSSHQMGRRQQNFYPRPLRGGRRICGLDAMSAPAISIHALCEEGDSTF